MTARWGGLGVLVLFATIPLSLSAQVAWDAPSLMAPGAPDGWGFHLIDTGGSGDGLGLLVTQRSDPAPVGVGFRIGVAEGGRDDLALFGGIDVSGPMYSSTDTDVPVDVIWHSGIGAGLDGDVLLSVPAGIVVGVLLEGDGVLFRPYAGPKVVLDAFLGDGREDDLDLNANLELGMDFAFRSGWILRTAASVGRRDALSIGVHAPT